MKRVLKIVRFIAIAILSLVLIVTIIGFFLSEGLPEGQQGEEADLLAQNILTKLNYEAFQKTERISWTFAGIHSYDWYKNKKYVIVSTDDYKVKLDLNDYDKSEVIFPKDTDDHNLIQTSIKNFNNDSFWLIAPYKIMEDDVERRLVSNGEEKSLLVTYTSGGSTPGDSYLWKVDKNNKPTSFKMWVSIIPVGGLEAKWEEWVKTPSGMLLSHKKTIFGIPITISNLETSD